MNKLTPEKKKQMGIWLGGAFVIAALLYQFGVMSQKFSLIDEEGRQMEVKGRIADAETWIIKGKYAEKVLPETKQSLADLEQGMAPISREDWKLWLRTELYNVQTNRNHDIQLGEITLDPGQVNNELLPNLYFSAVRFRVPISGYYQELGRYLSDVENRFRFIRVENMEINRAPVVPGSEGGAAKVERLQAYMNMVALIRTGITP